MIYLFNENQVRMDLLSFISFMVFIAKFAVMYVSRNGITVTTPKL